MKIINQNKFNKFIKEYNIKDTIFVLDFDGTVTLSGYNSFAGLEYKNQKMQEYLDVLCEYYWPIERASCYTDILKNISQQDYLLYQTGISFEDFRDIMMQQWWDHTMIIAIKFEVNLQKFDASKMKFRSGMKEILDFLLSHNHDILIASAGVKNFIDVFFSSHNMNLLQLHIVANEFKVDSGGKATGYNKDLITPFTKQHLNYTNHGVASKKYAIQIGDSLGDAHIVNDHFEKNNILKIGITHGNTDKFESFSQKFDIILEKKDESVEELMELFDIYI